MLSSEVYISTQLVNVNIRFTEFAIYSQQKIISLEFAMNIQQNII